MVALKNMILGKYIIQFVQVNCCDLNVELLNLTLSVTEAESWVEASNGIVKKSQAERSKSSQLRSDIETAINAVGHEMWEAWGNTNNALARRATEMLEAKEKLQIHLNKVITIIFKSYSNII